MGLIERGIPPSGELSETSHSNRLSGGYSGLTPLLPTSTRLSRRAFLAILAGGTASLALSQQTARADEEEIPEVAGVLAGGEMTNPEPAGYKTEDGYEWVDGKSIIVSSPLVPVDFDKVSEIPLKDVQTGSEREALPLHQELRAYIDLTGADRLIFANDLTLPQRYTNGERSIRAAVIGRPTPPINPQSIFAYSETVIKPTDDPAHRNDLRVNYFLNPECPALSPEDGDVEVSGVVVPYVYRSFYDGGAANLAEAAFIFRTASPDTKLISAGYSDGTPVSRLAFNMGELLPFQIASV